MTVHPRESKSQIFLIVSLGIFALVFSSGTIAGSNQEAKQYEGATLTQSQVDQLVGQLVNDDEGVRQNALKKLSSLEASPKQQLISPLIVWMTSYDGEAEPDRSRAIPALTDIGTPAVSQLMEALKIENRYKNGDTDYRHLAADILGNIGPSAREAIPLMMEALREPQRNDPLRESIFGALRKMGPEGQKAREEFLKTNTVWISAEMQRITKVQKAGAEYFQIRRKQVGDPQAIRDLVAYLKKQDGVRDAKTSEDYSTVGIYFKSGLDALIMTTPEGSL